MAFDLVRRRQGLQHFSGNHGQVVSSAGVRYQYDKFVTAQTGDGIACAHAGFHTLCGSFQHLVAGQVAVQVVDQFEIIEIEVEQADAGAETGCPFQRLFQPVE